MLYQELLLLFFNLLFMYYEEKIFWVISCWATKQIDFFNVRFNECWIRDVPKEKILED